MRLFRAYLIVLCAASGLRAADAVVGWNFDSGFGPEQARDVLIDQAPQMRPSGSWIRLRMDGWGRDEENAEKLKSRNAENGGKPGKENAEKLKSRNAEMPNSEDVPSSDFAISESQRSKF